MKTKKNLDKIIIIEVFSLILLVAALSYSLVAITKANSVYTTNNFVVDIEKNITEIISLSDGEALSTQGDKITVTNNNNTEKEYELLMNLDIGDNVISNVKIAINDIYLYNLSDLEKENDSYIIYSSKLPSGYTKIISVKLWFLKDSELTRSMTPKYDSVVK